MTVLALTAGYGVLPIQGAEISVQVTNDSSSAPEEYVVGVEESALAAALDGQEVDMTITSFKNAGLVAGTIEDGVTNGLAIGEDSYVKNDGGLAIGNGAKAGNERTAQTDTATHATAIGTNSKAASDNSTAIGYSSNASGKNSIAIGDSIASGENNIAIGHLSELTNFHKDNTAIGAETQINADAGTVVGKGAYVSGDYGTAIGRGSKSWSDNSVALGSYAKVDNDSAYAVALGAGSVASEADTVSVGVSEKDADNEHAVKTRRIVNVKDGRFEEGSTDAVTAGQLYDAGIVPGKAADGSVAIGNGSNVTNMNGVAIGNNALVNYSAENGVAIGQGAEVRTDNATAIGQGSRVVNGDGSVALGQGSMVTATDAKGTDTHGVVSVGFTGTKISEGFTRRLINVSDGVNDSDAATYGQVKDVQANVEKLDALAVKYDNTAKNSVTFAGTSGTSLKNVSDIVMNVENPINHKAEQHSFQNAGLLPGKVEGTATDGKWNMAIGEGSEIAVDGGTGTNMKFNTAIGNSAGVSQAIVDGEYEDVERSTAIGHAAKVRANNSTAIGDSSNVSKDNGVAVGQKAEVQSATSVAIGQGTKIGSNAENSIAIGTSANGYSVGNKAKNSTVVGVSAWSLSEGGTVIGKSAKIQGSSANGTAIGMNATINVSAGNGNVALGADSSVSKADIGDDTAHGVVSVGQSGDNGFNRRIINVADGVNDNDAATVGQISKITGMNSEKGNVVQYDGEDKSVVSFAGTNGTKLTNLVDGEFKAGSTDAVTAGQLYAAGITPGDTRGYAGSVAMGGGYNNYVLGANGTAIGYNASAWENALAIGNSAGATHTNSTAIGQNSHASADNATAIGQNSEVIVNNATAIGYNAEVDYGGDNSVALGANSDVDNDDILDTDTAGVVSVGSSGKGFGTTAFNRRIINVADGVNDSDAATFGQVKAVQADVDALDALAVQYDSAAKDQITFDGTNGTALNNISDIVMNTKDFYGKNAQFSFQDAGLLPGDIQSLGNKWNMAIGEGSAVKVEEGTGSKMQMNTVVGNKSRITQALVDGEYEDVEKSTALGQGVTVAASNAVGVGQGSNVRGEGGVAVGMQANVSAESGVAVGKQSKVSSDYSIAIGGSASVGSKSENSVAMGYNASSLAAGGTAIGQGAKVQGSAANGTAIGKGAIVNVNAGNSVALGASSQVRTADIGDDTAYGVVSVGKSGTDGFTRRIVNVADGINDSDAATVGQIKTMTGVDAELGGVVQYDDASKNSVTFQSTDKAGTTLNNVNDITMNVEKYLSGTSTVQGYKTVSFKDAGIIPGTFNGTTNKDSIVLGRDSTALKDHSVVIGSGARAIASNTVSIGTGASADANNSMVIGSGSKVTGAAAINGTAVGTGSQVTDKDGTALGYQAYAWGEAATVIGDQSRSWADGGTTLGQNARIQSGADNSVALGKDSYVSKDDILAGDTNGVVSVGVSDAATDDAGTGVSKTAITRRIINVADGTVAANSHDAVTGGQLYNVQSSVTALNNLAVKYDSTDKDIITLEGENGTKLTNLADGEFKAGSTDAVTAGQLYKAGIVPGSTFDYSGSMAIGFGSNIIGDSGTAIGNNAGAGENAVAVGNGAGAMHLNATAVGENSNAMETGATALGGHAWAEVANATAIGYHSDVEYKGDNSVALGANSIVATEDILDSDKAGVVSVGSSGHAFNSTAFNRRIINVADGVNDSDAATVGQIKTITGVDSAKGNVVQYDTESKDQITFGGVNGTALLNISNLTAKTATIGTISFTDDGRITNVTAGVNDSDVATVGQIKNLTGLDSAQGNVVQYDKNGNLDVGVGDSGLNVDDTAASLSHGDNSVSVGADGTTVTGDLNVTGDLTFNGETVSSDDLANAANVAGDVSDIKGQIGAGADGTLGLTNEQTTLVGGINANTEAINSVKTIVGDGELDNGAADLTSGINANSAAIEQNRNAIGALGSRVSDLGEEVDSVGAISAALAGLHPLDYNGTGSKFQISAALGTYDGTQAAAIGGFYHFNRDTLLSIGGSTSFEGDRKTAANIGVTFRVGEGASDTPAAVQDNETKQQMEAMAQEIEMLKAEIEQMKHKDDTANDNT